MARTMAEAPTEAVSAWAVAHAREVSRALEPAPPGELRVDLLTDPWSVWCWGMEPVRRAIVARYPDVRWRPLVGGMFPRLPDPAEVGPQRASGASGPPAGGFDVERFFAVVQRTTGMPLRVDATRKDRPTSTFPACIHVHAVRLLAPDREDAYLRALREAAYLDARNVSRPDVAAEVAEDVGVPAAEFREALASGEPEREFRTRLEGLHALGLHGYPTVLVTWRDRTARLEGFQSLPALLGVLDTVSGRVHVPDPPPSVVEVVTPGERVATREVAEVLGVSTEAAYDLLEDAASQKLLARERHATGDVWTRA